MREDLVHRDEEKMVDARKEFYENVEVDEKWERWGQFTGWTKKSLAGYKLIFLLQQNS